MLLLSDDRRPRPVIKVRAAHVPVVRITGQRRLRACSTGCGYGLRYCVDAGPLRDRRKPKYDFSIQIGGVLGDQLQGAARVAHERLRELFKLSVNSIQPITPGGMSRVGRCTWTVPARPALPLLGGRLANTRI
jgi:hypothetical protein